MARYAGRGQKQLVCRQRFDKTPDDKDYPISNNARKYWTGTEVKDDQRPVDRSITGRAMNILSNATTVREKVKATNVRPRYLPDETYVDFYDLYDLYDRPNIAACFRQVHDLINESGLDPRTISKRWETLIKSLPDSFDYKSNLISYRDMFFKANAGGTGAYVDFDLDETDKEFQRILDLDGAPFFIREQKETSKEATPHNPRNYPVIREMTFNGVKNRCKPKDNRKHTTKAKKCQREQTKNINTVKGNDKAKSNGYVLSFMKDKKS